MGFIMDWFGGSKKSDKPPKQPKLTDQNVQNATHDAQVRANLQKGIASTFLTGGGLGNYG